MAYSNALARCLVTASLLLFLSATHAQRKIVGHVVLFQNELDKAAPLEPAQASGATSEVSNAVVGALMKDQEGAEASGGESLHPEPAAESGGWPAAFPAEVLQGHEDDLERVKLLHSMFRDIAINNTVIVVPANLGFLDQALNVRCRLFQLGATNLLIWALDKETSEKLDEWKIVHFYDPTLFSVSKAVGYGVDNSIKGRMMSERPRVWWRILATGFDMLFLDADVVVFQKPERFVADNVDLQGQLDYQAQYGWELNGLSNTSTICAGVFWIRSSAKTLKFMDLVVASFSDTSEEKMVIFRERNRWDDQLALNYVAHNASVSGIVNPSMRGEWRTDLAPHLMRVAFAEPSHVLGGTMWHKTSVTGTGFDAQFRYKVDGQDDGAVFKPVVMHLNGFGMGPKAETMKSHGWWVVDNSGGCKQ